ncbi:MAG: T9SS type A sorting domain-containing protein [Putridiphycobacter sp.]
MKKIFTTGILSLAFITQLNAQNWNQVVKNVNSDRAADDFYGISVGVSGNFAVVGASGEDEDENEGNTVSNAGSVYVLNKDVNGNWVEYQKLVASDREIDDIFGSAVSISDSVIVVGAYNEDEDAQGMNNISNSGSAYIFKLQTNGVWTETQKIVASDRGGLDGFGYALSIHKNTIVVGASQEDHDVNGLNYLNRSGSAYIFEKDANGDFVEVQKIVASDRIEESNFGSDVAVFEDQIIIGSPVNSEDENGQNFLTSAGAAYVFKKVNGTWTETQKVVASDRVANARFGEAVSINGNTLVVGASYENMDENSANFVSKAGAAYVFELNQQNVWEETQKIVASDRSSSDYFGNSLRMNGGTIVVGAYWSDLDEDGLNSVSEAGSAYVFVKNSNNSWEQVDKITSADRGEDDYFGIEVAIDENNTIIVGSYRDDEDENNMNTLSNSGSAYIFEDCRSYKTIDITSCGDYTSPSGNYTYSTSGVYSDTLTNAVMCDSIITINLTVNHVDVAVSVNGITLSAAETGATYQWLDCNNGNQPIQGATSQTFTPTENGSYTVEITKNNCTETSACTAVNSLNTMENEIENKVNIYPNPGNENVNILLNLSSSVSIIDLNGKVVFVENNTSNNISLNVSDWEAGVYFVQVINENGVSTQKLIVK